MYQDGKEVGRKNIKRKVFDSKPQFFYLGTGAPKRSSDIKSYRGLIKDFCYCRPINLFSTKNHI